MYLGLTGMLFIENFKKKNNCTWKDVWLFLSGKMKNAKFYPVTGKPIIFLSLLSLGYGGLIEIIQEYFSLNRTGDWFDFLADAFGIIIAICILTAFQRARLNPSSIKNT